MTDETRDEVVWLPVSKERLREIERYLSDRAEKLDHATLRSILDARSHSLSADDMDVLRICATHGGASLSPGPLRRKIERHPALPPNPEERENT